ncbi:glycosyltransferase [Haloprofundus marisrubri]|uniref:glycosyltransferase n=1 Tax=Haloprofundus marisrubri TaxID=1514971 RepID=UPI00138EF097|nr:glycosyltransferase family 4 protein [Haloprofundus marisrubri]
MLTKWLVPWNGTCQVCVRVAEGLVERGHAVSIITNESDTKTNWIDDNINIVTKPRKPIEGYKIIKEHISNFGPDILHSHDNMGYYFELFSIPHVVTSHSNWPRSWFLSKKHIIEGVGLEIPHDILMRMSDKVVSVSNYSKSQLRKRGIESSRVYNGITDKVNDREYNDGVNALFVGRIGPRKGKHLPEIWKSVTEQSNNCNLDVIGYPADKGLVKELKNIQGVTIHGSVDSIKPFYQSSDVLLFPSRAEACPLTVLEAQQNGCPVIAFDICSHRELIDTGSTGSVIPAYETTKFAQEALSWAKTHNSEVSSACESWISNKFSNEMMIDEYVNIYLSML